MNVVWISITAIQMLTVPTQMDLSTVHVTKDTVATEHYVKVNFNNTLIQFLFMKYFSFFLVISTVFYCHRCGRVFD